MRTYTHIADANTPADVIAKLATLGEPRQIADHLLAQGIRGDHRADSCPVARYVHQETGTRVAVDHVNWGVEALDQMLPANVANLVRAFDYGFFPELDIEEAQPEWCPSFHPEHQGLMQCMGVEGHEGNHFYSEYPETPCSAEWPQDGAS